MTVASTVDTNERKSTQANSPTQYYSIEDIAETVTGSSTAPTTTTVNISSAQILAMGTTPIELLPALSGNQYYDVDEIILEFDKNGSISTLIWNPGQLISIWDESAYLCQLEASKFSNQGGSGNSVYIIKAYNWKVDASSVAIVPNIGIGANAKISLTTYDSADPSDGGGSFTSTAKAIITYTTRTFGA